MVSGSEAASSTRDAARGTWASIVNYIVGTIGRISGHALVVAIRRGLTMMIPLMLIGSMCIFVNNLPIPAYQSAMTAIFGPDWKNLCGFIYNGTFNIMSVCMLLTISYSLAKSSKEEDERRANPVIAAIVSMACLLTVTAMDGGMLSVSWVGPLGVFIAMITAVTATALFVSLFKVPFLRIRIYSNAADPTVSQAISGIVPAVITLLLFGFIRVALSALGIADIHQFIYDTLKQMFSGMSSSLATALTFVTLTHTFWFVGMHGNNVLEPVAQSVFVPAGVLNQELVAAGMAPTQILTKEFFDVFVYMGGSGVTLGLIIAVLIIARRSNTRKISFISLFPGLINVNEPVIYGAPIVLNFYYLIPFLLLPPLLTLITYAAMTLGIVPLTGYAVEWTTPILLGGYVATGSIAGSLMQLFNLLISVLVYIPFVRLNERYLSSDIETTFADLRGFVDTINVRQGRVLMERSDAVGNMARMLAGDLKRDIEGERLILEYQPQMDTHGRVIGVEALLRWPHAQLGRVIPPVAITIAEESGQTNKLGTWILQTAMRQYKAWADEGIGGFTLSVNITPSQLSSPALLYELKRMLAETGIAPGMIEIEITEQAALGSSLERLNMLGELKALGVRLAMDDFGMGHSSLMYLKEFNLDTIKLDGMLVRDMTTNANCKEIIRTITGLCRSMDIMTIAEFVETRQQRDELERLDCDCFQGYLYSPALPADKLAEFVKENEKQTIQIDA